MAELGKELRIFQVDAFATKVFEGNPAAVVPLDDLEVLQQGGGGLYASYVDS